MPATDDEFRSNNAMIQFNSRPHRVLVVASPSPNLERFVVRLQSESCQVEQASSRSEAIKKALEMSPEVVIIDGRLPDASSMEVTMQIRNVTAPDRLPLVLMPAASQISGNGENHASDEHRVGSGAEPLIDQLASYIESHQQEERTSERIACQDVLLDRARHRVWVNQRPLRFTPTEFNLLWELASRPGYVLSRAELSKLCKGSEDAIQARTTGATTRPPTAPVADSLPEAHRPGKPLRPGRLRAERPFPNKLLTVT